VNPKLWESLGWQYNLVHIMWLAGAITGVIVVKKVNRKASLVIGVLGQGICWWIWSYAQWCETSEWYNPYFVA
jgi:hypothetical protein